MENHSVDTDIADISEPATVDEKSDTNCNNSTKISNPTKTNSPNEAGNKSINDDATKEIGSSSPILLENINDTGSNTSVSELPLNDNSTNSEVNAIDEASKNNSSDGNQSIASEDYHSATEQSGDTEDKLEEKNTSTPASSSVSVQNDEIRDLASNAELTVSTELPSDPVVNVDYMDTATREDLQENVENKNSKKNEDSEHCPKNSNDQIIAIVVVDEQNESTDRRSNEKATDLLHVDQDDEDLDNIVIEQDGKDPIGNENETSQDCPVPAEGEKKKGESTLNSEPMEVDETDEASNKIENVKSSEQTDKEKVVESCIVLEELNSKSDPTNKSKEYKKTNKKFDITPVRLEKLMDPEKLANKTAEEFDDKKVTSTRPQRLAAKKAESQIKEMVSKITKESEKDSEDVITTTVCSRCCLLRPCKWLVSMSANFCVENCYKHVIIPKVMIPTTSSLRVVPMMKFQTVRTQPLLRPTTSPPLHPLRKCAQCNQQITQNDKVLAWEAMEFCSDDCLNRYQLHKGSFCQYSMCEQSVPHTSMGKYAVRFGLEARQFCSGGCLESFKKVLKSCGYCQKNVTKLNKTIRVTSEDKHTTKEFCSMACKQNYDCVSQRLPLPLKEEECTVCTIKKKIEFQVIVDSKTHPLCNDVCLSAFNFANNITDPDQCHTCQKYYEANCEDSVFVFHEDTPYKFCSKICLNVFILFKRKIVPCCWCKVKKYNFDMIRKNLPNASPVYLCSVNCLTLYQVSTNVSSSRKACDHCSTVSTSQYHITMSDATIRNFCSYNCVMVFQTQYSKSVSNVNDQGKPVVVSSPVPLGEPKKVSSPVISSKTISGSASKSNMGIANGFLPQITATSGTTLKVASPVSVVTSTANTLTPVITSASSLQLQPQTKYIQQIILKPAEPKSIANKNTQCRPTTMTKGVSCKPKSENVATQTDEHLKYPAIVPIPVPIYVPVPMHMYTTPYPVPVPFPLPIPVPVFIPTTQKTFKGLTTKIKEILEKTPSNPYEADLLLMASMIATEDRVEDEVTKNESDEDTRLSDDTPNINLDDTDVATEVSEPPAATDKVNDDTLVDASSDTCKQKSTARSVDLEAELTSNTITLPTRIDEREVESDPEPVIEKPRTRKRAAQEKALADNPPAKKRGRGTQQQQQQSEPEATTTNGIALRSRSIESPATIPTMAAMDTDRPDAGMCLKFTIGIRGWKQWIIQKNEQIEQAAAAVNKKAKTFNTNILKLTTDELNYLLCRFVKEIRKPNGKEYAPDTIYYLCLSIQQYLSENGRVDNIFTDPTYDQFTDALDEVAAKFSEVNESTQYVLTRVEEEHLWESKQLGAYSPHVLLATLIFFNTKYFNLATIEEHMQLSFSHIMKHWKRNSNAPSSRSGSPVPNRNVLLRFYSPQSALDAPNSRKKKIYEQHENEANPLRCPVKLYEFYLSKCPESVKQRNDLFYLQPERSCVPDSPVWYSTMPLQKEVLKKILHRIRMVKEVNISFLAS